MEIPKLLRRSDMAEDRNFALIGAAGYIAPRHMKAIGDVNGSLLVATDPNDSVGVIDGHFPDSYFFTEFEKFDDFVQSHEDEVQYLSICSPNHMHESHIKYGLRSNMNVICEKPLVLNEAALDRLQLAETKSEGKVNCILQLRLHEEILKLKESLSNSADKISEVELTYITSRGRWYEASWKGDQSISGGVTMNIGVHFFDMLGFLFGEVKSNTVYFRDEFTASGYIEFGAARVKWFLSVDRSYLPDEVVEKGQRTYRNIEIDDTQLEFSQGFTELHTKSYQAIVEGRGFGISDARQAIRLVEQVNSLPVSERNDASTVHSFVRA